MEFLLLYYIFFFFVYSLFVPYIIHIVNTSGEQCFLVEFIFEISCTLHRVRLPFVHQNTETTISTHVNTTVYERIASTLHQSGHTIDGEIETC